MIGILRALLITVRAIRAKEDLETQQGQAKWQAFKEVIELIEEMMEAVEEDLDEE